MHLAHRCEARSSVSERPVNATLCPYRALRRQIRAGRALTERTNRQLALAGAYLDLFYAPFHFYGDTPVSEETKEGDDVRESNDGRQEYRALALADGTCVIVREIQAGDAPALQRF